MWRFILTAVATIGLVWLLNVPLTIGTTSLPPLGKFMSPSHGFWQNAERHVYLDNTLRLKGVEEEVKIIFDRRMVPHIFASNSEDLYFAQGYITAMNRLWQLDISTRAASGRISEILGDRAIGYDKTQINQGSRIAAAQYVEAWKKDSLTMTMLEAYTDGINSYIERLKPRKYPVEFKLLNYAPEPWDAEKSAYFVRSMANTLCVHEYDLEFSTMLDLFGRDTFDFFYPEYNPAQDPIIPPGTKWGQKRRDIPVSDGSNDVKESFIGHLEDDINEDFVGSNNWAVSGSKTASGKPILCNDPHLSLSLPSIWYEIHLNAPDVNVYGASLPGMPFVISGFNDSIAWGETNVGHDVLDWYRIDWIDEEQTKYRLDGKELEVELVIDTIRTKSGRAIIDTVKYTHWGPVIKDGTYAGLAMRWIANENPHVSDLGVFWDINKASTPREFMEAIDNYFMPAQNFVYADVHGNIGLRIGGSLPVREYGQGRFVSDGDRSSAGWTEYIPADENPYVINPPRGFVSSANQKTTDDTYPYYYAGGKYFEDYRGTTLNRYLNALTNADKSDMQKLQHSDFSLKAEQILPLMIAVCDSSELGEEASEIVEMLRNWDYLYDAGAIEPIYFEEWYGAFFRLSWDEVGAYRDSLQVTYPESWRLIDLAITAPDTFVFDVLETPETESFSDVVIMSLNETVASLSDEELNDWGNYRKTEIRHLAGLPGFSNTLDRAGGHGDALNATTATNGPSWRMIVELTEPVDARVVYPGGQSGNPGSKFYDNMIDDWVDGRYFKAHFTSDESQLDPLFSLRIEKKGK